MKKNTGYRLWSAFLVAAALAMLVMIAAPAWATDWDECDHPRFLEKGCGYEGEDGEDGADGADGADGQDGADGRDGVDGIDGRDGRDGIDGVVPTKWRTETHNWYEEIREAAAAQQAMQVYLPQDQKSRLTMGMSRVANTTGVGLGYAYMIDNDRNSAFTIAVGVAGSETAVSGSFGFEFGGDRSSRIPAFKAAPTVIAAPPEPEPEPIGSTVTIPVDEYDQLLMAQVQQEELDDHEQQSEDRYTQQQHRIEALEDELEDREKNLEDLERLKREQAELQAAEEARAARRAAIREKLLKNAESKNDG